MSNQENNLNNGVITSQSVNKVNNSFKKKMDKKKILFIGIFLVLILLIIIFLTTGKGGKLKNNALENEEEVVEVDLSTGWGKEYSIEAQKLYSTYDIDRFDVSFVNLDFLNEPEMVVKYRDKADRDVITIYYIDQNTNKAITSKNFTTASIKLIYSLEEYGADFYVNIIKSDKYGTYTLASKIIKGTVVSPDIMATNEKELTIFNKNYVNVNYALNYYQVKKDNFVENFTTIHDRYNKYSKELEDLINELDVKYSSYTPEVVDDSTNLTAGLYTLAYGDYVYDKPVVEGIETVKSPYENSIITLKSKKEIIIDGITYKFSVNGNVLTLDNGFTIKADLENHFILSDAGGTPFKLKIDENLPLDDEEIDNEENIENSSNQENSGNQENP